LEKKRERERSSISCPGGQGNALVMCEWEVLSVKGRIVGRSLKQIDCFHPELMRFGGSDCNWECEKVIAKREG
jgi:hypothetical protein